MKTALITTSIALLPAMLSLAPAAQAPAARGIAQIAYVSGQRILADSPETKAEFAKLPAMQQQRATELRAKQQALETTRQQLAQAGDGAARAQLQLQEQQQRTDFERASAQAQIDLQTLQRQLNTDLQVRVKAVVEDLVKGQNIQLVLSDTAVIWATPSMDLTAAVVQRLNAKSAPAK
jgi:Skp family chaperone for outer membrane proteins